MSCQDVKIKISQYIDGEIEAREAMNIHEHLGECGNCRQESDQLRRTVDALRTVSEVEPPSFLLEQIMAATVERPTITSRLRAVLEQIRQTPRQVGTVAASAFAIAVLAISLVNMHTTTPETGVSVAVNPPSQVASVPEKQSPAVVETKPSQPVISIAMHQPTSSPVRSTVRHHRHTRVHATSSAKPVMVAKSPAKQVKAKPQPAKPVQAPIAEAPVEPAVSPTQVETAAPAVAATPAPEDGVKIAIAAGASVNSKISQQVDALKEVRATLAERNRHRTYDVFEDSSNMHRVTVEIISHRF